MPETEAYHDQLAEQRATDDGMPERPERSVLQTTSEQPAPPAPTAAETPPSPAHPEVAPPVPAAPTTTEAAERSTLKENEQAAERLTTESSSRLAAAGEDSNALKQIYSENEARDLANRTAEGSPESTNRQAIERSSMRARAEEADDYDKWAGKFQRWIRENTKEGAPNRDHIAAALKSLGIDTTQTDKLDKQVEKFWKKYFEEKSDFTQFAADFAEGCREQDGVFNLTTVEQRQEAAKDLFKLFGEKNNINRIIRDHAAGFAVRSEGKRDARVKTVWMNKTAEHLQREPTGDEKTRLDTLYREEVELQNRNTRLEELLTEAKNNALDKRELDSLFAQQDDLHKQYVAGDIDNDELKTALENIPNAQKGLLSFDEFSTPDHYDLGQQEAFRKTLKDLRTAGDIDMDDAEIEKLIEHEAAHFSEAKKRGLNPKYELRLERLPDNKVRPRVHTAYDVPADKQQAEAIVIAPRENCSNHDLTVLDIAREDLQAALNEKNRDLLHSYRNEGMDENLAILHLARELKQARLSQQQRDAEQANQTEEPLTDENIQELLTNAQNDSLTEDEIRELETRFQELQQKIEGLTEEEKTGERGKELQEEGMGIMMTREQQGLAPFPTEEDFRRACKTLGQSDEQIDTILSQLKPSFDQTRQLTGTEPKYAIQFRKKVDAAGNTVGYTPAPTIKWR